MNKHMYKSGMIVTIKKDLESTNSLCGYVNFMDQMIDNDYPIKSVSELAVHIEHPTFGSLWFSAKDVMCALTDEEKANMEEMKKPTMFDPKNL